MNATDLAIKKLTDKIVILQLAIEEIQAAKAAEPSTDAGNGEPKVRKTRKKRGMPAAEGL